MNRKDLVRRVATVMRENNVRKHVSSPKHIFHISDDEGNTRDLVIRQSDKNVLFTVEDVEAVIDACLAVILETMKQGETISIRGFGTLAMNYRKARRTRHPDTGEPQEIPGHYVPKFTNGKDLKMCGRVYELAVQDGLLDNGDIKFADIESGDI